MFIGDSMLFTYNGYLKFVVIVIFNSKFKQEFKTLIADMHASVQNAKLKLSNFNFSFTINSNSKTTSEVDSNSGS